MGAPREGERVSVKGDSTGSLFEHCMSCVPQAIAAIEEAVQSMSVGGVRRIEILGSKPELGYPLIKGERFSGQRLTGDYFK